MDKLKLNPFPNVPASGLCSLATNELAGRSVHAIIFELGGTTYTKGTHITDIKIKAGKTLVENISGAQLQDLNDYAGVGDSTNYLVHYFGDPTARTIRGQHLGDLDLSLYDEPLEIEVTNASAVAPTLQCYALVGAPKLDMGLGYTPEEAAQVRALIRTVVQPSAAVTRTSYGIGLGSEAGARVRSLNFFHTNLTSVEFKKHGTVKHDDLSDALNDMIQTDMGRVPQAGLYVVDFIADGNQGEAETTVQSNGRPWPMQVNVTTSAGDTIPVFADVHAAIPML